MFETVLALSGILTLAVGVLAAGFVLGMRAKSPLVVRPIVAFCKRWMNPSQMRTAGTPGAYAGIIRHRGRTSGRAYQTPVGVVATDDGFVIGLPYGQRTQWARNVLAAGSATLVTEGRTWLVDHAELVPTDEVIDAFGSSDRRGFRLLRTDQCLRLHRVGEAPVADDSVMRSSPVTASASRPA
jgi:deazaflavin-dependent oxidoreductase (nitroreductase family)